MIKQFLQSLARKAGYEIVNLRNPVATGLFPQDFDQDTIQTVLKVRAFTVTSPARIYCLVKAVEYVLRAGVPGSIVECGVWKGGSMMAVAETLRRAGRTDLDLFLFDTFENWHGMPPPTDKDGPSVRHSWEGNRSTPVQAETSLNQVRRNLSSTGYPDDRVHLVEGTVEDTLPARAPSQISILRLDTDLYESTRHELVHLYPRLSDGGVLIIDDYGSPEYVGAKKAVDEYIEENRLRLLLNRIDADGRIAVKPGS